MNIGIVGHGVVGSVLSRFIRRSPAHRIVVYDKFQTAHSSSLHKESVNSCDLVFLCVPTPSDPDGTCDVSAVEECAEWITCPLCVRSTIPPGTTDRLSAKNGRLVGFSPEYIGEPFSWLARRSGLWVSNSWRARHPFPTRSIVV
jgi:UDPglucose 6-dehydrogenase